MSPQGMGASPVREYRRRGSVCDDDNLMILTKLLRVSLIIRQVRQVRSSLMSTSSF